MTTTTINYSWQMPDPGGSANTWGDILNSTTQAIDAQVFSTNQVVTAVITSPNTVTLNTTPGPAYNLIAGQVAGTARWEVYLGDADPETGLNAGSNFIIQAYDDTGAFLSRPLEIARATGAVTMQSASVTTVPVNPNDVMRLTDVTNLNPKFGSGTALNPSQAVLTVDNPFGIAAQFMASGNKANQPSVAIRSDRSDGYAIVFTHGASNTAVGSIANLGSSVTYNTTSDYRTKITYGAASGVGEMIDAVPVHDAAFKDKPDHPRPMFLAHELQEACPWAVTGEKDGAEMQQVSLADLAPVLWAEVQSLRRRIAVLEGGRN